MSNVTIPIFLAVIALVIGLMAHSTIRRGLARFYALERETLLRRASYLLIASLLLFVSSIGLMVYMMSMEETATVETDVAEFVAAARATANAEAVNAALLDIQGENPPMGAVETEQFQQPDYPTVEPTATIENAPTQTPTPSIRRAIIENTSGYGVNLRTLPGTNGEEVEVLEEQSLVTMLDEIDPVDANGFIWIKIRTVSGNEGWVADLYLTVTDE